MIVCALLIIPILSCESDSDYWNEIANFIDVKHKSLSQAEKNVTEPPL